MEPTRRQLAIPTLIACAAAGLALVVAVGLQAPAVSVGLRWEPEEPSLTFKKDTLELLDLKFESVASAPPGPSMVGWFLLAVAVLAILFVIVRWLSNFTRRAPATSVVGSGAEVGVPTEADAKIVRSGLAAALQILNSERDSSDAVVQAWQGLQDAAAAAGLERRPAETASEFTARILYRSRGSAEPIAVLLSLYQRVRFGHYAPNAADITAARESLATLVDLWQSDLPERRAIKAAR